MLEVGTSPIRGRLHDLSVDITRFCVYVRRNCGSHDTVILHHDVQLPNEIPFFLSFEWRIVMSPLDSTFSVFYHRCFFLS